MTTSSNPQNPVNRTVKWVALVVLPAITVFYTTVAPIWGWERIQETTLTLTAINVLVGTLVGKNNDLSGKDQESDIK